MDTNTDLIEPIKLNKVVQYNYLNNDNISSKKLNK